MIRFSLILLLCCLTGKIFSQEPTGIPEPNYIPVVCYWSLGDTFEYAGLKEFKFFEASGQLKDSTIQEFNLSLVVADSTDSTYVIQVIQDMDWENMTMILAKSGVDEKELKSLLKGQECQNLEYVIDQNGAFLRMKNLDTFVKSVTQVVHKLIDNRIKSKDENKAAKQMQSRLLSPEIVQNKTMNELVAMHRFYGYQFPEDSLQIFDDEIPNVFSPGETITRHNRLIATILPEGWDGLVSIQDSMTIDGEDAMTLIRGYFAGKEGVEMEDYFRENPVRYTYNVNLVVYPENGLVYAVTYEQSTYIKNKLRNSYSYFMVLQEE